MAITIRRGGGHTITTIVVSTIMGHAGDGMFPYTFWRPYIRFTQTARTKDITIIAKSATRYRHKGNFRLYYPWTWKYIQEIGEDGLLNAYGLTNAGVQVIAPKIARACQAGYQVVPSFYPQFSHGQEQAIKETLEAVEIYYQAPLRPFWVLEFNFSCPNSAEEIEKNVADALACVKAVRREWPSLCIIAKISIVHPYEFARELVKAGADVIHAVNTIPWAMIYPNRPSPLAAVGGGGVSGGPAFIEASAYNRGLRQALGRDVPIIMGCGVMNATNAKSYFTDGADAVSICTVCRLNPPAAEMIIQQCV